MVHFTPTADGGTQVDVRMAYSPPAGILGHSVAAFFGSDPKSAMDADLLRLKSLLEQGRGPSSAGEKHVAHTSEPERAAEWG
jgi:uncharacterized membrane protein